MPVSITLDHADAVRLRDSDAIDKPVKDAITLALLDPGPVPDVIDLIDAFGDAVTVGDTIRQSRRLTDRELLLANANALVFLESLALELMRRPGVVRECPTVQFLGRSMLQPGAIIAHLIESHPAIL